MSNFIKSLPTPIAIIGMGRSGEAAKKILQISGVPASQIVCFDTRKETDFRDPDILMTDVRPKTLVVSPGVPLQSAWIQSAKKSGVIITSDISLAASCLTTEKLIGITGSVGKSTVVSLLGAGLHSFSPTGFVGGNLGTAFSEYAAEVLSHNRPRADWVVLELSSYQLENCQGLTLDWSGITFLSANHLERYDSLEHYYETKWALVSLTKNNVFLNKEGGDLVRFFSQKASHKSVISSKEDADLSKFNIDGALLLGSHNQDNLALAVHVALAAGWPISSIAAMKSFPGLPHRLENLGETHGVRFINDSKATAMESVQIAVAAATESLQPNGRLHVLLGGRDKNLPWSSLKNLQRSDRIFHFFGECGSLAQKQSQLPGDIHPNLQTALTSVAGLMKKGDTVLLSPGGTSLDEFRSFEDRGDYFKSWVRSLTNQ